MSGDDGGGDDGGDYGDDDGDCGAGGNEYDAQVWIQSGLTSLRFSITVERVVNSFSSTSFSTFRKNGSKWWR